MVDKLVVCLVGNWVEKSAVLLDLKKAAKMVEWMVESTVGKTVELMVVLMAVLKVADLVVY